MSILIVVYDNSMLLPNISTDGAGYMSAPAGLQTGLWAATDDGGGVYSIFWYDSKGRRGYEITDTDRHRHLRAIRHTYAGQLSMEFERVYDKSTAVWKYWDAERKYGYDSAGRLEWETATSDSCTAVIKYSYDAAGRLSKTEKGLRKGDSGTEISGSSVTCDYTYDVHGWKVKIVTGIPMKLAAGGTVTTDISTPYYGAASSEQIKTPGGVVAARTKYTETIHYADGAVPRYNGTPSARDLTQGGRYDYRYDTLDRLIAADYTPPSGKPDTDFSTGYTYDILSRPTSIKRHGVVDVDGADEVFGLLDNLTLTYDGATLGAVKSIITDETGRDYYGRTGFAKGTYMASAPVEYNAAGRLVKDTGRMLSLVRYNTTGLPVLYSMSAETAGNPPRQERSYDATGAKRRQTDYGAVRGQIAKTADRRYMESFTFNADTLERIDFTGGYFDGQGKAHFLFTDWQGNVTMTTDAGGRIEQHTGYYPYGEPWREPSGQHAKLFAGKERVTGVPGGDYDFGPRGYRATTGLWDSWDIHAADYAMWSPWMYCGGNPIRNIDRTGELIIFINGMHSGNGGSADYWEGIDNQIMKKYNDYHALYYDGAIGGWENLKENIHPAIRQSHDYNKGLSEASSIVKSLKDGEHIRFVTHSMGAAYAKGFIDGLITDGKQYDNNIADKIDFELDLAPFQPKGQKGHKSIPTMTIQHHKDGIALPVKMPDAVNNVTHKQVYPTSGTSYTEHKIKTFKDDIDSLEVEFYKKSEYKKVLDSLNISLYNYKYGFY